MLRATSLRNPDLPYTRLWLRRAYARTGRFEQAIAVLSPLEMEDLVGAESKSALGRAHADAGNTEEATRALNHLRERMRDDYVSASFLAAVQLGLDDTDGALASLAQAATEHSY